MKKILCVVCIILNLFIGGQCFANFNDIDDNSIYKKAVDNLTSFGILSGYHNEETGITTFSPQGNITRAEMAKIVTIVLGYEDEIALYNKATGFSDVISTHWANPYINISNQNGIIKGYVDGTYGPSKQLTYSEAITIVLRLLDYSTDVLGSDWPDAYIAKAKNLELLEKIAINDVNLPITRAEIAIIIDKALGTDLYNSNKKLVEKMDYQVSAECVITDAGTSMSDEFTTSIGSFKKGEIDVENYLGEKVKLAYDENKNVMSVIRTEKENKQIIVDTAIKNGINGITISEGVEVYYGITKSTYGNIWTNISKGDVATIYYSANGNIDYIYVGDSNLTDPIVIKKLIANTDTQLNGIDISKTTIIRNGETVSKSDIRLNDVVYYNSTADILTVYSDKITGVYEEAYPSKTDVKSIKIAGQIIEIETLNATSKLNESTNSYKLDDKITVALGSNGKIVDVIAEGSSYIEDYAIILSTSQEISTEEETKGATKYYVTLFNMSGQNIKYESARNFESYVSKLVKYDFEEGLLVITPVTKSTITGRIDKQKGTIDDIWTTKDTKIIEKLSDGKLQFIELEDIAEDTLKEQYVLNIVRAGAFNDIQILYLDNITKSNYQYGIVTNITKDATGEPLSYDVITDGSKKTYRVSGINFNLGTGTPKFVRILVENGSLSEMEELKYISGATKIDAIDENRIKIANTIYRLASDVIVYQKVNYTTYKRASLYDIDKTTAISLYTDNQTSGERWIKIIVIN